MPSESEAKLRSVPGSDKSDLHKKQFLVVVLVVGLIVALLTQPDESGLAETDVTKISNQSQSVTSKPLMSCENRLLDAPLSVNEYSPAVLCEVRALSRRRRMRVRHRSV